MILRPNMLAKILSRSEALQGTVIVVLLDRDKAGWWTAGVVWSNHPSYQPGGYNLAVHPDQVVPLTVDSMIAGPHFGEVLTLTIKTPIHEKQAAEAARSSK